VADGLHKHHATDLLRCRFGATWGAVVLSDSAVSADSMVQSCSEKQCVVRREWETALLARHEKHSSAAAQQHSSTAAQQHSSTAAQQHSSTAAQQLAVTSPTVLLTKLSFYSGCSSLLHSALHYSAL
jgi:hypothetical protein